MSNRLYQIAIVVALAAAGLTPAFARSGAVVTGVVRDSRGTPQMGALVQLLAADSSVVAQTYTNLRGGFLMQDLLPGTYRVKATGESFLPTLREGLRIRGNNKIDINLTLNTLFEAIQWLPAEPRSPNEPADDWKWTLRSSSNRPLLRFLQDGPLVVVTGDDQSAPQLEARVDVSGGLRRFGQSGTHSAFELERSGAAGGHLILRADLGPHPLDSAQYLAGYEQPLGPGREIRTSASFQNTGGIRGASGIGSVQTASLRGAELVNLGPNIAIQLGSQIEAVRGNTSLVKSLPFAIAAWHSGGARLSYSVATSPEVQTADEIGDSSTLAPTFYEANGALQIERGTHQELRAEAVSPNVHVLVAIYEDRMNHPIVEGGGVPSPADFSGGNLLYDSAARLIRASGPSYTTAGFTTALDSKLAGSTWVSVSFTRGGALAFPVPDSKITTGQAMSALQANRSEAITGAAHGVLPRTGTHWRASYRWQPASAVTAVDPFDYPAQDAFLGLLIRQPVHCGRLLPNGTEALIAVRNLLAEGYRPFLTPDGSTLYFAQTSRAVFGGLSFTF